MFFSFFIPCKRTNNSNNATHYLKLGKKRRESSKRNYYIISSGVIIKAIIVITESTSLHSQKVSDVWAEQMDYKLASVLALGKMSYATATRSSRSAKYELKRLEIMWRYCTDSVGPWHTCLESVVDMERSHDEMRANLKASEGRVCKRPRSNEDSRRLQFKRT